MHGRTDVYSYIQVRTHIRVHMYSHKYMHAYMHAYVQAASYPKDEQDTHLPRLHQEPMDCIIHTYTYSSIIYTYIYTRSNTFINLTHTYVHVQQRRAIHSKDEENIQLRQLHQEQMTALAATTHQVILEYVFS
jgi:hypothetical protein